MTESTSEALDLRDYFAVIRRRRWTIVQTVIAVFVVAMAGALLETPTYGSSARLLIESLSSGSRVQGAIDAQIIQNQEVETQKEVITSVEVAQRVADLLESRQSPESLANQVRVSVVPDSAVLIIRANSTDPERAQALAQGFAKAYLDFRRDDAIERVTDAAAGVQQRLLSMRTQLAQVRADLAVATGSERLALELQESNLVAQIAVLETNIVLYLDPGDLVGAGGRILNPAKIPQTPSSPRPMRSASLGLLLGLALGIGVAFVRDFLDDTIRSDEEAARVTGAPVLGHIPRWADQREGELRLVTLVAPASPVAESYRSMRTNIRFLAVGRTFRSLLVTSAGAGEGKTTTAANLAVTAARAGGRVLLVSVDLRRPALHRAFGMTEGPGLSDVLAGDVELADVITDVGVPNLRVVPSGQIPPNPAELLGSSAMTELVAELEQVADLVIFDATPLLAVADALELAPRVGGVLMVVDAGRSGRRPVRAASERVRGVGARIVGTVLNNVAPSDAYYYAYYYEDYTAETRADEPARPPVPAQ